MPSERKSVQLDDPHSQEDELGLREHDREVLGFLLQNPSSLLGFQGLKRKLRIHPEQLSRALRRLASDGLVEQTELGYRITQRALGLLDPVAMEDDHDGTTVIQASMPSDVDLRELVAEMKGTWIRPLRWHGITDSAHGQRLSWVTPDNQIQIDAQVQNGLLTIYAQVTFQERLDEAIKLGHMIFQHISRTFSREGFSLVSA